jgi:hypothetical protein
MGGEGGIRIEDVIQLSLGKFVRWHMFDPWMVFFISFGSNAARLEQAALIRDAVAVIL